MGPGGRALAVVRPNRLGTRLRAGFVGGQGGVLRDLLLALRFEADIDALYGFAKAAGCSVIYNVRLKATTQPAGVTPTTRPAHGANLLKYLDADVKLLNPLLPVNEDAAVAVF